LVRVRLGGVRGDVNTCVTKTRTSPPTDAGDKAGTE
jgi:hypothetical protein